MLFVTASDAAYFDLAIGTIQSLLEARDLAQVNLDIAVFDLGLNSNQLCWLKKRVDFVTVPNWDYAIKGVPSYLRGLLARPHLRKYFPGYDLYVWVDADAWIQEASVLVCFERFITNGKFGIAPELDFGYRSSYTGLGLEASKGFCFGYLQTLYSYQIAQILTRYPILNAGVWAAHKNAPHWEVWDRVLAESLRKDCNLYTDQFALNKAIYLEPGILERTIFLPVEFNWVAHRGWPLWDPQCQKLVNPGIPHRPIGILHLTANTKKQNLNSLETTTGGSKIVSTRFVPSERWDYCSPTLTEINLLAQFPKAKFGDPRQCDWPWLRRFVPHIWRVDPRREDCGFVSWDEAQILYNTALKFKGERALEIGCWMGWSAAHLLAGGVSLDIVDPILKDPEALTQISASLKGDYQMIPGESPNALHLLAGQWKLAFIDGNHEGNAPLQDVQTVVSMMHDDCLILFHDLASPHVAKALKFLHSLGWNIMIYQTMQIMGVAWIGNVEPVAHIPDPDVLWSVPEHLQGFRICNGFFLTPETRSDI